MAQKGGQLGAVVVGEAEPPVVMDDAEADFFEPTLTAEDVLLDFRIREELDH